MSTDLLDNHNCGHQYLDAETNYFNSVDNYIDINSLQVILSLNEYSDSFWEENFCPISYY